jgi:hypothetical protein
MWRAPAYPVLPGTAVDGQGADPVPVTVYRPLAYRCMLMV